MTGKVINRTPNRNRQFLIQKAEGATALQGQTAEIIKEAFANAPLAGTEAVILRNELTLLATYDLRIKGAKQGQREVLKRLTALSKTITARSAE